MKLPNVSEHDQQTYKKKVFITINTKPNPFKILTQQSQLMQIVTWLRVYKINILHHSSNHEMH